MNQAQPRTQSCRIDINYKERQEHVKKRQVFRGKKKGLFLRHFSKKGRTRKRGDLFTSLNWTSRTNFTLPAAPPVPCEKA